MDEKDSTCYIIGDTIILPFDLNDNDVLNVENVASNIGTINHPNQQPEYERDDEDKSSRTNLKHPTFSSDWPRPNNTTEFNELDFVNRNQSTERTGFEFDSQSREDVFEHARKSIDSNLLELAIQQAESNELEFRAHTGFAEDYCETNHAPYRRQLISSDNSETKIMTSYREGDKDVMANYNDNIMTCNSHLSRSPSHFSRDMFTSNSPPCVSPQPTHLPVNEDDNNVLTSSNYECEGEAITDSFWHGKVEHEDDDANSYLRPLDDMQRNPSYLLTAPSEQPGSSHSSQSVNVFILPDEQNTDNINYTNTSWGDENTGVNSSGQNCTHRNTRNNFGQEYFVNDLRENSHGNNSSIPCDVSGHPVSNERLPNPYSANTAINNCANNEENRWYLPPTSGAISGNGNDRLSMNNVIELPVYPRTFLQQHQMQGMYHQFDPRYSSVLQPGGDIVHQNVNSFQQAQAFQPYMEQVYTTNDNFNRHFNPPPNFVMNRPVMYESQPSTSSFSQGLQNDDDSTGPYFFPQLNGGNLFTADVKVPKMQGYFQPEDIACLESPMKDSTSNQPTDPFIEKILHTVHGEELSTEPAYQSSCQEQVADENNCMQSLDVADDVKLQKVLSMERALRCEIQGNSILPPKAWASKYQSASGSKQMEPVQELDPKTKAEMKREEVANAAKAIFMKRTGTLFHWIHPGESKSELKTRVEQAWSRLSEKESNYYFSQVLGRCNSDFQTRPMVNPRLMELLNPGDYQELAGILNNGSAGDMLLPEPMENTKRPKQNNPKQKRPRQRPVKGLNRNSKITRGYEASQAYSPMRNLKESDSFCDTTNREDISSKFGGSSITDEHLSYQSELPLLNQSNDNEFLPFIENGLPDFDQAAYSSERASGSNLLNSSSNYDFSNCGSREDGVLSNRVTHSFENSSGRQKSTAKNRGPRGPYKKKGRRSKNATDSDDDWELNPTVAKRGVSMSGKEKPSFSHSNPGENDSENSHESSQYRRNFETDGNSLDSDGNNTLNQQDQQYSLSESLTRISSSGMHKKKGSRGPRGPYKKRKQESGRGRGRGRGRPPKRRKVSSDEDDSSDESFSQNREDSFSSPQNPNFSTLDWSGRQSEVDLLNDDDSFDPCVSRQCESFSGKVKPSLQLQEELRNSSFHPEDTNSEVNSAEERTSNDERLSQQESQPRCSYGSSLSQGIYTGKRICERKGKSKSPARAKARTKASEAFLVESEAMQMQFYQEVSSGDDNKNEHEGAPVHSLPLTSADMAVKSLRRLHGSANKSRHATSGSDNSDVDWSPRQLRCMSGKTSSRRSFRTTRTTKQGNSQTPCARSVVRKEKGFRF